ncbi:hypothetical protein SERLA73DRAFT_53763 [Serpula lacrymans var. lacrymans S7.3]|uniref:Uncharacterized protein n=1 Tax=Serpula lacrymans var. lacrymans (strain S7.3) TaxID=936435 RepID=F8PZ91_SERL3|nr:hypothetical protein SERLA73DRAFT_53763 [Serpula lacrymans var. lacrymans S7.3]
MSSQGCRPWESALHLGPRKKLCLADPLVHHGQHFGRTIHALCNIWALLANGIARTGEFHQPDEYYSSEENQEYLIYRSLLRMIPGLEDCLLQGDKDNIVSMAEMIQRGSSSARSDDTKSLKGAVLDWITPCRESHTPPLARNVKTDCGFHHDQTGALLCPAGLDWSDPEVRLKLKNGELLISGDQWPVFLYQDYVYNPEDPWNGLSRSLLLVLAYRHIFTSPSSVNREPKATQSGNTRIHGMTKVTPASIAYVATQVYVCLNTCSIRDANLITKD